MLFTTHLCNSTQNPSSRLLMAARPAVRLTSMKIKTSEMTPTPKTSSFTRSIQTLDVDAEDRYAPMKLIKPAWMHVIAQTAS